MTTTAVPTDDLRTIFDIATSSLNFSSGFLDTWEVECLRRIAVILDVDPMVATPGQFATQYPHAFAKSDTDRCDHCNQPAANHPDKLIRRP